MSFNINSLISKLLDKIDNSSNLKPFVGNGNKTQKSEQKSRFADWYGKFISTAPPAKTSISQNVFLPQAKKLDFTDDDVKKQWQAAGGRLYSAQPENSTAPGPTTSTMITAPSQIRGGVEIFTVSAGKNPLDPVELSDLVLKQMGYTAGMVKAYEQKYGADPRRDLARNFKDCLNTEGCVTHPKPLPGEQGAPTGLYPVTVEVSNLTTMRLRNALDDLKAPGKAAIAGKTPLEIAELIKAAKEREAIAANEQLLPFPKGQIIAAAGITIAPALPFPKTAGLPQINGKTLGNAAIASGELALPASIILLEAVAPLLTTAEFLNMKQQGAALEYIKQARTQALEQSFPPLTITMDAAEPLPRPQSEPKPKERPFAEPTAPTIPDITTAPQPKPGDLVKPEVKPDTKAKPETTTSDLPQPYTPDVPRNNQPTAPSQPPNSPKNLDHVIPPIIAGTAAGKVINDVINETSQLSTQQKAAAEYVEAARKAGIVFANQEAHKLEEELTDAKSIGINPMSVDDSKLPNILQEGDGKIKWAVDTNGKLWIVPHDYQSIELKHSVLTGGSPVLAAGEAQLTTLNGKVYVIEINNDSGHFKPSDSSTEIGRKAFVRDGAELLTLD